MQNCQAIWRIIIILEKFELVRNKNMNSIELNLENQIHVKLYCEAPIDLDLALFYQTKHNQSNGVFPMEYT